MMQLYCEEHQRIVPHVRAENGKIPANAVWIDLFNPTREEELAAENFLGIAIPTREEMGEIEISNRLYQENGVQFMTATLVASMDMAQAEAQAVTFVVAGQVLVTVRYVDLVSFHTFATGVNRLPQDEHEGVTILLGLLEAIVDRVADVLEKIGRDIDGITKCIFRDKNQIEKGGNTNLQDVLMQIGRCGDLVSKVHESLVSLSRLSVFAAHNKRMCMERNDVRMAAIRRDITGLSDHTTYLTNKVQFLLDASLGMVSIQQNNVFRILSVASLIFMPPTLIAGIYGMNFKLLPELNWHWGYPVSLLMMVFSAVLPLAYLKQKKYL